MTITQINAVKIDNNNTVIGYRKWYDQYFVNTPDGIMTYDSCEMNEIYNLTDANMADLKNMLK